MRRTRKMVKLMTVNGNGEIVKCKRFVKIPTENVKMRHHLALTLSPENAAKFWAASRLREQEVKEILSSKRKAKQELIAKNHKALVTVDNWFNSLTSLK